MEHAARAKSIALRPPLFAAALLLGATVVSAGAARMTGLGAQQAPMARPVAALDLRFVDRADGAVAVLDAGDGHLVHLVAPGGDGFIRGTLRGLVRERKRADVDDRPPFRLTRWSDGTLTLEDDATGRRIDLDAFGPTNAGAFAAFFDQRSTTP